MTTFTFSSTDDLDALLKAEDALRELIRQRITNLQDEAERPCRPLTTNLGRNQDKKLCSPQEIAKKLGISRDQVVKACDAGELECFMVPVRGGKGRKIHLGHAWMWFKEVYSASNR